MSVTPRVLFAVSAAITAAAVIARDVRLSLVLVPVAGAFLVVALSRRMSDDPWLPRLALASLVAGVAVSIALYWLSGLAPLAPMVMKKGFWLFASDAIAWDDRAHRLVLALRGATPVWEISAYLVGFAAFVGSMYLAFGSHPLIMAMINSTLSALCVVLVYRLATHLGTRRAARIAAAAVAVWPSALLWGSQVMKDVPSLCLLLVIVVLTCELFDDVRRGWPALVLSGSGLFMVSMFLETLRNYLVMMFLVAVVSALVLTGVRARRLRIGQVVAVVALGLGLLTTRLVGQDLVLRVLDPTHSRTAIKPFVTRIVAADSPANAPLFGRLAGLRNGFIRTGGGSLYTHEGVTNETGWLQWLRWAPEAFVAALGAPFPWQWRQAGRIEPMRVAVGSESLVLLLLLPLMLFACWRIVRTWAAGGLVFVLFFFMFATSLGLTVVNVGTLVRLRLPVIFLGLVLAAVGLAAWRTPASVAGETVDREEPPPLDASSRGRDQVSLCS